MKMQAVVMTIEVFVDVDSMKPDVRADFEIQDGFEFLATQKDIMAGWLHKVADDLEAS